jgi:hypothetical protein
MIAPPHIGWPDDDVASHKEWIDQQGGRLNIFAAAPADNPIVNVCPRSVAIPADPVDGNGAFADGNGASADGNGVSVATRPRLAEGDAAPAECDSPAADIPHPPADIPAASAEINAAAVEGNRAATERIAASEKGEGARLSFATRRAVFMRATGTAG